MAQLLCTPSGDTISCSTKILYRTCILNTQFQSAEVAIAAMAKKQKFPHLVGSKWTAQQATFGWRHFRVVNRNNQQGLVFAEMVAACDPEVRFWINAKGLKNRQAWQAGWQSLQEQQSSRM